MVEEVNLSKLTLLRKDLRRNETAAEKRLWQYIRRNKLGYKFLRQVSIGYFVVDFYCKELSLAIELDGDIHSNENVKKRDEARQGYLEEKGVRFLRFTNEELFKNTEKVLLKISKACHELSLLG